jgi:beta-glucosidase
MQYNFDDQDRNNRISIDKRAREILSGLTLTEKTNLMAGNSLLYLLPQIFGMGKYFSFDTPSLAKHGLPGIKFIDGPRGITLKGGTAFPSAIARGASWDVHLQEQVGEVMGHEAAAAGANLCGAVCVNLLRHPAWGRAQETLGEDPYHVGTLAAAFVGGLQKHVMACVKHYAANSIERSRYYVDVKIEERALREIYLPHFRMCVDAGAASVMSAYNKVNGQYCGTNRHLLRDILKDSWGFRGFVISDWLYGTRNTVEAANAGLDLEMPFPLYYGRKLRKAVKSGAVSVSVIDEAATRLIGEQIRHTLNSEKNTYDRRSCGGAAHAAIARKAAQKSMVLLKNEGPVLPLVPEKIKKIAVIGRLAAMVNLGDRGSSDVRPPYAVTPLEGIRNGAGPVEVVYYGGGRLSRVRAAAAGADAVIVVAGFTWKDEGEYIKELRIGGDRMNLDLHQRDIRIINAASRANDKCVVVLESGTAVTMDPWVEQVGAVIMAWYPGMEGGNALADILFGRVNPCGKLPIAFPRSLDQLFPFDNRTATVEYGLYHGYRHFERFGRKPLYPFGYGLSYTRYRYGNLVLSAKSIGRDEKLFISVEITNEGSMAGEETAQLYIGYGNSRVERPVRELKGFGRISLRPGERGVVLMMIGGSDLAYWDTELNDWVVERIEYTVYVGPSSGADDLVLTDKFTVD